MRNFIAARLAGMQAEPLGHNIGYDMRAPSSPCRCDPVVCLPV
jgi:hypothetical protein